MDTVNTLTDLRASDRVALALALAVPNTLSPSYFASCVSELGSVRTVMNWTELLSSRLILLLWQRVFSTRCLSASSIASLSRRSGTPRATALTCTLTPLFQFCFGFRFVHAWYQPIRVRVRFHFPSTEFGIFFLSYSILFGFWENERKGEKIEGDKFFVWWRFKCS